MDRQAFITAMRGVAHSVCVVTTNGEHGKSGATVSAFCSVSADPPTALVCLNSESRIATDVIKNGFFNINILPETDAFIAQRFAGMHDAEEDDRFRGIDLLEADVAEKIPEIKGATLFKCEVQESVEAGSHHVIIGRVLESQTITDKPLIYQSGEFRKLAD